jgi:hypothetical protein
MRTGGDEFFEPRERFRDRVRPRDAGDREAVLARLRRNRGLERWPLGLAVGVQKSRSA